MKPIFIYKYEKNMQKKSKEFFNLFMKQGNEIEMEFQAEGMNEEQIRESGLKMVHFTNDDKHRSSVSSHQGDLRSATGYSYISK
jgi:hypothetical protein